MNGFRVMLAGLVAAMQAPSGLTLTLEDAIAQAVRNNRNVQIATLEVDKADNDLRALQTRKLPNFDLKTLSGALSAPLDLTFKTGVFGTYPQIGPIPGTDTVIRTDPRWSTVFSARVAQPLTQLRTVGHGEEALQLGRDLAREAVREQELAVAANVKQLYYGIAQAQSGLQANNEAITLYRDVVRLMADYEKQEAVLPADALAARAALAKQEHTGVVLENTMSTLKEQLNALLGRDPGVAFSVAPVEPPPSLEFDLAASETRALTQRPEVRQARLKAEQARMAVTLKHDELVPEVNLAFIYLGFYNFEVLPKNVAMFGVTGSWEPWDWGRRRAEAAVKAKTLDQATLGVAEAENLIKVDVRSHARKLQEARALLNVTDLGRQAAREKLRVATERFRQEANLQRDVLQAEAAVAEADLQHQQALAGFWTARAEFDKALGDR